MSSGQIIGQIIINNEKPVYSDRFISDMKLKIGALYRFHRGINQNKLGTCLNELKMIQGRFNKLSFSGLPLNLRIFFNAHAHSILKSSKSQILGPLFFGLLIPYIGTAATRVIGTVEYPL